MLVSLRSFRKLSLDQILGQGEIFLEGDLFGAIMCLQNHSAGLCGKLFVVFFGTRDTLFVFCAICYSYIVCKNVNVFVAQSNFLFHLFIVRYVQNSIHFPIL